MIELRWCVEKWTEYPEGSPRHKSSEPKLQYRTGEQGTWIVNNRPCGGMQWSDWTDVPTETIEG